jgi:DNA-binding transcriptional ArsR family regulator
MTLPDFLTTLTHLSASVARAPGGPISRSLPVHVLIILLRVAEGNQRGEKVTAGSMVRYLGAAECSVRAGVARLGEAGLIEKTVTGRVGRTGEQPLIVTEAAVEMLRASLLSPTRQTVFPEPQPIIYA